jgi:hypothetical protein
MSMENKGEQYPVGTLMKPLFDWPGTRGAFKHEIAFKQ